MTAGIILFPPENFVDAHGGLQREGELRQNEGASFAEILITSIGEREETIE